MPTLLTGVHHVTAFAKHPGETHDFYTRVLGMRLVKKTVNFDDPFTYHLYFGDRAGTPGTLLTHFPHPGAKRGVHGSPEIIETLLAIPVGSLDEWRGRLRASEIAMTNESVFGAERVRFEDPHGMRIAIAEHQGAFQIEGVRIEVRNADETAEFLTGVLGFEPSDSSNGVRRLRVSPAGGVVELVQTPGAPQSVMGAGTMHHVAWRVPDEAAQTRVSDLLREARVGVTPVLDRKYFKSIYFHVPGGVIFEVATDGPGFAVDEPVGSLGESLQLPDEYESRRAEIGRRLSPL